MDDEKRCGLLVLYSPERINGNLPVYVAAANPLIAYNLGNKDGQIKELRAKGQFLDMVDKGYNSEKLNYALYFKLRQRFNPRKVSCDKSMLDFTEGCLRRDGTWGVAVREYIRNYSRQENSLRDAERETVETYLRMLADFVERKGGHDLEGEKHELVKKIGYWDVSQRLYDTEPITLEAGKEVVDLATRKKCTKKPVMLPNGRLLAPKEMRKALEKIIEATIFMAGAVHVQNVDESIKRAEEIERLKEEVGGMKE